MAWAAWHAAEHGRLEVADEIVALLGRTRRPRTEERTWPWVEAVLIDAAIRLRVPVARLGLRTAHLEALTSYLIEHPPGDASLALAWFERLDPGAGASGLAWAALGNHLHARRAPGLAAALLRRLDLRRELSVYSTDDGATRGPPSPPTGTVTGCGVHRVPPGLPPVPVYRLSLQPGRTSRLLAPGEWPVFVTRWLETREVGFSTSLLEAPPRLGLVASWLRGWEVPPEVVTSLWAPYSWSLDWTGRQPWVRDLQPRVDAVHAAYWRIARILVDGGLLGLDEAQRLEVSLRVDVADARRDTRRPLPPVPASRHGNPWVVRPAVRPAVWVWW